MYESVPISFSTQNLIVLNGILAGMIFGVSMGLKGEDLLRVIRKPKAPVAGLIANSRVARSHRPADLVVRG